MVESLRNDDKDDHQILKDKSTDGETSSRDSSYTASNVASSNISPADSLSRNTEYINGITIEPLPIDGGRKDSSLKGNEGAALRKRNTHRPRIDSDVLTRPTLCNARFALFLIKENKLKGNPKALLLRAWFQKLLFRNGCRIQRHPWIVLFVGLLLFGACGTGLLFARLEIDIEKLWVENNGELISELEYTKRVGGNATSFDFSILIQTSEDNILNQKSFAEHLEVAKAAIQVKVEEFNRTWHFDDVCFKQSIPTDSNSGDKVISELVDQIIPCIIIGPLDCFFEGSKLLGPREDISIPGYPNAKIKLKWDNADPLKIIDYIEFLWPEYKGYLEFYRDIMIRGGFSDSYLNRFCLMQDNCTNALKPPNINEIISNGCAGFATEVMKWPTDLIFGDVGKDPNGTILSAKGIQTLFNLNSANQVYERNKKKNVSDWDQEKADRVLDSWQRAFVKTIYEFAESSQSNDSFYAFTPTTTEDTLLKFSNPSIARIVAGYILMIAYACFTMMRLQASKSQGLVGVFGVLLVVLSVVAGLGLCSFFGISFNPGSIQVLPFLLLGIGVDDMFLMSYHFGIISIKQTIPIEERMGECLKRIGVSVTLTSVSILFGFLLSLIIPMPALQAFGAQAAVVTLFNLVSVLVIFPAMLSLDLERRKRNKLDILFCFDSHSRNEVLWPSVEENELQEVTWAEANGDNHNPSKNETSNLQES